MKLKILTDALFICERLKEIDRSYFVLYNTDSQKFEVHSSEQRGSSYCFTVPFEILDCRTVDHALKTRVENKDKIIAELDKENEMMMKKVLKEEVNKLEEALS
jgi:hypothetical protein